MLNAALVNFAAGETSPRSRGRFDLPWFAASCEKVLNYIPEVPGSLRFRPGLKYMRQTRGGAVARLVPFRINADQNYMLEFTSGFMRVYRANLQDILTVSRTTITAATKANPCVVTVASTTSLANGDEIIVEDAVGMFELNGRQVKLANKSGSTYELVDPVTGAGVDSTNWGTWTSGGAVSEVYEIASPYLAADLDDMSWAQTVDTLYVAHRSYAPRKVTVDSTHNFTIATFSRTNDPFSASAATLTLTNLTRGTTTNLVFASGSVINEDVIYTVTGVVGTTEINSGTYKLEIDHSPSPNVQAFLKTTAGEHVDSSGYTAYTSDGTFTPAAENPVAVALYEGRLWYIGSNQRPQCLFGSMAPNTTTGATRYDTFTGGSSADNACFFSISPSDGKTPALVWGKGSTDYFFAGAYGGPFRISGGGLDEPITPTAINVRQIDNFGCEAVLPTNGPRVFFIQRGGVAVRTIGYDQGGKLLTYDMLLNAEHIAESPLRRVVLQTGRPDVLWVLREDGVLAGMTVHGSENVAGWSRHKIGGQDSKVLDAQVVARTDKDDQLWAVTERVVGGVTRRFVEVLADDVSFPDFEDFYLGGHRIFGSADEDEEDRGWQQAGKESDLEAWKAAVYRRQEEYIHLDAAGTYNGADRGDDASATLTPSALTGEGITFTASAAVFRSSDVGNELWKKPNRDTGAGTGRAVITAYVSSTVVTCRIEVDFDVLTAIAAGDWHIAAETIYGLAHLEGQQVAVVVDGAVYSDAALSDDQDFPVVTVADGKITLEDPAAVVHVGLPYEGFVKTHNLELGGQTGPAQNKPRNIAELFLRFLATLGVNYGTDLYDMDEIAHRDQGNDVLDRPAPVFSGARQLKVRDTHLGGDKGKYLFVNQKLPVPCVVQSLDVHFDVTEDA